MRIRPLIIDAQVRQRIADVMQYAQRNVYTLAELKKCLQVGNRMGDDPGFVCDINFGYRAVYTLEEQVFGLCHHISISVAEDKQLPSFEAFVAICAAFGVVNSFEEIRKRGGNLFFDPNREEARAISLIIKVLPHERVPGGELRGAPVD